MTTTNDGECGRLLLLPSGLEPDFISQHGDGTEAAVRPGEDLAYERVRHLVRTVHLPFHRKGRINFADPKQDVREEDFAYVKAAIEAASPMRPVRYVAHPLGLRQWEARAPGDWDVLVRMHQRLADETRGERTGPIVIENNRTYWNGIPDETPLSEADRSNVNRCFGETAAEWADLATAVDRDDVLLCMDTSHATTSAQLVPEGSAREAVLREFLSHRDRIVHIHWSDSILQDNRGRPDNHRFVGQGTLPEWFHREVRDLGVPIMFEVQPEPDNVVRMLEYVRGL